MEARLEDTLQLSPERLLNPAIHHVRNPQSSTVSTPRLGYPNPKNLPRSIGPREQLAVQSRQKTRRGLDDFLDRLLVHTRSTPVACDVQ
jgi:hypothetical protein